MTSLFNISFNSFLIIIMLSCKNSDLNLILFVIFDKCCSDVTLIYRMGFEIKIVILISRYDSKTESTK